LQPVNIILTAKGYSAVYNGDYLSSIFSSTGGGTNVVSSHTSSVVPSSIQSVRRVVPVNVVRAGVPTCVTAGDPHVWSFDGWAYSPHVEGPCGPCLGTRCAPSWYQPVRSLSRGVNAVSS
jgi:hypothetical protein